jgi:hypothetical protein
MEVYVTFVEVEIVDENVKIKTKKYKNFGLQNFDLIKLQSFYIFFL